VGIKLLVLTAKHHDGFCLWPSAHTDHSVKRSPWRGGRGDVVREVAEACRAGGVKFGIYLSPWDRHEPTYGTDAYNAYFRAQLTELLTNYGPVHEVWFDGACGEGPNGKRQVYDFASYYAVIRRLQPEAAIAVCGPDVRWVGNEDGLARENEPCAVKLNGDLEQRVPAEWNAYFALLSHHNQLAPPQWCPAPTPELLAQYGPFDQPGWWPAECDVSLRPGWFYHASEDLRVKSLPHLLDIYYRSVGRSCVLLLNIPPDRRGLFHEHDVARLREFGDVITRTFARDLVAEAEVRESAEGIELAWPQPVTFNRLLLQEEIAHGQAITSYTLEGWHGEAWKPITSGPLVGYKRLDRFGEVTTARVRLQIAAEAGTVPRLGRCGLFLAPPVA
jgi:alpha-L-fucosidase